MLKLDQVYSSKTEINFYLQRVFLKKAKMSWKKKIMTTLKTSENKNQRVHRTYVPILKVVRLELPSGEQKPKIVLSLIGKDNNSVCFEEKIHLAVTSSCKRIWHSSRQFFAT